MNENEKKVVFTVVFLFVVVMIVMFNNRKKSSLEANKKFTTVKILTAEVFGKNQTKLTFYLQGKERKSYSKLL